MEKMLLVRRSLVGVTGRNGDGVDPEVASLVEERRRLFGNYIVEQGAVDVDAKAALFGGADRGDRSCISLSPSRCTDQTKNGLGWYWSSFFCINSALVHR